MKKTIMYGFGLFCMLFVLNAIVNKGSDQYTRKVNHVLTHVGKNDTPMHITSEDGYKEDFKVLNKILVDLGTRNHIKGGLDLEYVQNDFESRMYRSHLSSESKKLDKNKWAEYSITYASQVREKSGYGICHIKLANKTRKDLRNKEPKLSSLSTLVHEAFHCRQLMHRRRVEISDSMEGFYFLNSNKTKKPSKELLPYKPYLKHYAEYVMEMSSDIASLMYFRFDKRLEGEMFDKVLREVVGKRKYEHDNLNKSNLGHYTYPTLLNIQNDLKGFDEFKKLYKKDPIEASLRAAYKYGGNNGIKLQDFVVKYKYLFK